MKKILRLIFSLGMLVLSYASFHFAFAQETIEWEYNVGGIEGSETITLPDTCANKEG